MFLKVFHMYFQYIVKSDRISNVNNNFINNILVILELLNVNGFYHTVG